VVICPRGPCDREGYRSLEVSVENQGRSKFLERPVIKIVRRTENTYTRWKAKLKGNEGLIPGERPESANLCEILVILMRGILANYMCPNQRVS
jgi:hypothetical protein